MLGGAGRTYTWNKDNRLDVVNGPGSAVMAYDYTGIRVKKTGTGGTTLYPFTGYEIQGGTVTKHIRLGNEIVASKQGSARFFYHNDHLGGVNVISNESAARVQLNEYDPWGKVSRSEGNTDPNHRFTGQELDVESEIHYYGGRYYDQVLGRFISPDPFVQDPDNPQNINRYSYVLNSPQGYIDPSGYFFEDSEGYAEITLSRSATIRSGSSLSGYSLDLWNNIQSSYNQISSFSGSTGAGSLAALQFAGSTWSAYAGATAVGSAIAAGGCAAALPVCIGGGLLFAGGVYGASDAITSLAGGQYQNPIAESIKEWGVPSAPAMVLAAGFESFGLGGRVLECWTLPKFVFLMINDLAQALRASKVRPLDIKPIRLVEREGFLITIDNRRLEAFRRAGIEIPTRMATRREIRNAIRAGKFSAGELGSDTIIIRGEY